MEQAVSSLDPGLVLPEHEHRAARTESYPALLARLSRLSVTKHFDAYADVDWEAPAYHVDPDDPRFELRQGRTARARPPGIAPCRGPPRASSASTSSPRSEAGHRVRVAC